MSQILPSSPATGPARFGAGPVEPRTDPMHRFLSALALMILVIGVPVVLIVGYGTPPVPTSLPTREDLTGTIGPEQLITVLVAVVWLAWLQFLACAVLEIRAVLAGGILAPSVPLAGPTQRLVRALIGAALLSATVVGPSGATVLDSAQIRPVAAVSVHQGETPAAGTVVHGEQDARSTAATGGEESDDITGVVGHRMITADPDQLADLVGRKVYVVQPPSGRHHDSLWEIAERHLGNGRRYHEIFQLNAGRSQPDGGTLHLARLIQPGWLLVMPEDAIGVNRLALPPEEHPGTAGCATTGATAGGAAASAGSVGADDAGGALAGGTGSGGAGSGTAVSGVNAGTPAGALAGGACEGAIDALTPSAASTAGTTERDATAAARAETTSAFAAELGAAGLLGAGLVTALALTRRRRRNSPAPQDDLVEAEVRLRAGADPDRAAFLDRALRSLGAADGHPPVLYAAVLDDDGLELLLAPCAPTAPAPWTVLDDGARWRLDRDDIPRSLSTAPCPYPGLVSLGRDVAGRDILLDLTAASGCVCVTGPPTIAEHVVRALAVELGTNSWSSQAAVTALDLPQELAGLAPDRLTLPDRSQIGTALSRIAERHGAAKDEVLTGHRNPTGHRPGPVDHVCAGHVTDPELAQRLQDLADSGVAVLVAGELPGARWRLEVDDAGTLAVPVLGLTVTANRLGEATLAGLSELFAVANTSQAPDPGDVQRPPLPRSNGTADDGAWAASQARIGILGSLCVRAPGALDPSRQELAGEMLAFLALHPDGVHPTVLAGALWPRGVTPDVRDATIDRVGDWLGTLPDGTHRLRRDPAGRIRLAEDVAVDWQILVSLLHRSRRAPTADAERDLLHRALRLVRGPLLSGAGHGRCSWLPRTGAERTVPQVIEDAAHRLVELSLDDGDDPAAGQAARCGLRADPTSPVLWRDLLRAEYAQFGVDGVSAAADEMEVLLADLGLGPDPQTLALLDELTPERAHAATTA